MRRRLRRRAGCRRFSLALLAAAFALLLVPAPRARGDQGSPPKESASETLTLNPLTPADHKLLERQEHARVRRMLGLRFAAERKKSRRGPGRAQPELREGSRCETVREWAAEKGDQNIKEVEMCCAKGDAACMPVQRGILKELGEGIIAHVSAAGDCPPGHPVFDIHDSHDALCSRRICSCPSNYVWNFAYDRCVDNAWSNATPECKRINYCWGCK